MVDAVTGFVTDSENQIETNCYVTLKISPKIKLKKRRGPPQETHKIWESSKHYKKTTHMLKYFQHYIKTYISIDKSFKIM